MHKTPQIFYDSIVENFRTVQYYCYVYYDENWQAYYVGKGQGGRMYTPQGHPDLPPQDRIQVFHFEHEWQAYECEIELIGFWKRQCDGGCLQNQTLGGPGSLGRTMSEQTKLKISKSNRGKTFGVKKSAEHRAKISAAHQGKIVSPETCAKISASKTGKKLTEETRLKMSAARIGKKHSPETRKKISETKKRRNARRRQQTEACPTPPSTTAQCSDPEDVDVS